VNNTEHKWIEDRLEPGAAPEPPEGLLEKIQEDIPRHLEVVPEPVSETSGPWRLRLLAASVVMAVLSGAVVYQIVRQTPRSFEEQLAEQIEKADWAALDALQSKPESDVSEPRSPILTAPTARSTADEPTKVTREAGATAVEEVPEDDSSKFSGNEGLLVGKEVSAPLEKKSDPADVQAFKDDESGRRDRGRRAQVESGEAAERQPAGVVTVTSEGPLLNRGTVEPKRERREELRALGYVGGEGPRMEMPAPSTGGTAEPNDAPYGDMFFRPYGTNPFIDTEDDPQSTFGLDVDTGSFTLARSYLDRGHLPPPEAIRVEEFVNFFDYGDPAPRRGEFTLIAEGAPSPFAEGPRYELVRFGIKAQEIRNEQRKPATLIFVVDTSGSMGRENRLGLVKQSLHLLLDQLDRDDRIGLVVYGSRGDVLLEPTTSKEAIRRAIDRLIPNGSTNAEEGLDLAYGLARRY